MWVRKNTVMGSDAWKRMSPMNSGLNPGVIPGENAPRIWVIGIQRSWMPKMRTIRSAMR